MIQAYIQGQRLRIYTPIIAADTIDYITAQVSFSEEWNEYALKYMRLKNRDEDPITYVLPINDGKIGKEQHMNLSAGLWDISVYAGTGSARITTNTVTITVEKSGLRDAPIGELPISTAEILDAKANRAIELARSVIERADAGEFNGRDGTGFRIKGYVETQEELPESGEEGDMYGVGTEAPYDIYVWDSINTRWVNSGEIQGPQGEEGEAGKYAVPTVGEGYLSWEWSDGSSEGLPGRQYIQGEQGAPGTQGPEGTSAYQAAVAGGYEGSEENFNQHLAYIDRHAASHAAGGSDPLTGISKSNLSTSLQTQYYDAAIQATWTQHSDGYYYQTINVNGILSTDRPTAHFKAPGSFSELEAQQEAWKLLYALEVTEANKIKLYAKELPETAFSITMEVPRL